MAQMTIAERNEQFNIRREGLKALDRKNLVANFTAYWPGENSKGVSRYSLMSAILRAEFSPEKPLESNGTKGTENWGS